MASIRDTLANLVEQYKAGDTPMANLMRGDTEGAKQSAANAFEGMVKDPYGGLNASTTIGSKLAPMLLGHTAYHGSPHSFEKFLLDKVGTGEGAQAFGHGIYFAENPKIAEDYAKANIGRAVVNEGGIDTLHPSVQVEAYKLLQSKLPDEMKQIKLNDLSKKLTPEQTDFLANQMNRGNLYKVDIPDEYIPKMLDWDKPINEQSIEVRKSLAPYIEQYGLPMNEPGRSAHSMMLDIIGKREGLGSSSSPTAFQALAPKAAEELNKAGIKGIKYLDQGSRNIKQGTNNFVVFDPSEVKILERNQQLSELLKNK